MRMTKAHKKFILEELIPFVLREQGSGFGMEVWDHDQAPGTPIKIDGIHRPVPSCGMVACIGGSISLLRNRPFKGYSLAGAAIGLDDLRARALFHGWAGSQYATNHWPDRFANRYRRARTALGKARVAVALLKEVVRTEGKCLDGENP